MTNTSYTKVENIRQALNAKFYEREAEIEGILVALLSKQHMLMIGPAGTAKSALSAELAKIVEGTSYFQWLLTRFSTPEEVFGPLSLKDLEQGVYKRNTSSKMPEAHLVFLDEIFKANSAILNSLLTLINERLFYNDGSPVPAPLMSVIGASNEYPDEEEGLEALFDRFLLRYEIDHISEQDHFISMMKGIEGPDEMPSMTLNELFELQSATNDIHVPDELFEVLSNIRYELRNEGIRPSDRRFKQALCVLKAKALLNQRQHVEKGDLVILENALWETADQKQTVSLIVRNHAQDEVTRAIESVRLEANEIFQSVLQDTSEEAGKEAALKLNTLTADLQQLRKKNSFRSDEIDDLLSKIRSMKDEIHGSMTDPIHEKPVEEKANTDSVFFKI